VTFWDSSALVPLLIEEPRSASSRRLIKADAVAVAWLARVEMASALVRLLREGRMDESGLESDLAELEALISSWVEIPPHEEVRRLAVRLLRTHVLRTLDALHLASAWFAAEGRPDTLGFVCFDTRLAAAARAEGFSVIS
jgi:predicted nucleic acid-binding protein